MANYYNPYQNNPMYNPYLMQQYQQPIQQQQTQPTIQQGGFVPVASEKEAMDYLVAQGTSVTFIDGKNSKLYVKTRGFSPLEQPAFKRYNLVEVTENDITPVEEKTTPVKEYAEKSEIKPIYGEIDSIKAQIEKLTAKKGKKDE
jgi:hypothetical protein